MKAYKIFDEEECYIKGIKQTIKFAKDLCINAYEYIECCNENKEVPSFIDRCSKMDITIDEALDVIGYAKYKIEELEIY